MKKIVVIIQMLVLTILLSCTNENDLVDLSNVPAPSNLSALTTVTQDNTGKVTFLPRGEGVTRYEIYFGDGTKDPAYVRPGNTVDHTYKEGVYDAKIVGTTIDGKRTEAIQKVVVSFRAPENLVVTVENDKVESYKVTVVATADFALFYEVYFGEAGNDKPVLANNGEAASYTYQAAGEYTIRVVSKSAAIATTTYTTKVTATKVVAPSASAPTPPNRLPGDVISLYGTKYTNVEGTNFFPDWGQGSQGSSWAEFDLNGDKMLNYINLSYQGIALADGVTIDVSGMDYIHMDVWTTDLDKIETSLISKTNGEKPVVKDLVSGQWTSIEIPISAFTSQGLTVKDIFQLKFVGTPWAKGSVFIDNIYFYRAPKELTQFPIDFESSVLPYIWTGFGGMEGKATVVANPDKSGANTSAKVLKMEKPSGAQTWAGATLPLDAKIDFTKGTKVKITVWSPKVGATIKFKMEDQADNKIAFEVDATSTVANAWEVLTFDLTGKYDASKTYNLIALFPDFGVDGAGTTYYFDDFKQSN